MIGRRLLHKGLHGRRLLHKGLHGCLCRRRGLHGRRLLHKGLHGRRLLHKGRLDFILEACPYVPVSIGVALGSSSFRGHVA
jgi:hypothetical protein